MKNLIEFIKESFLASEYYVGSDQDDNFKELFSIIGKAYKDENHISLDEWNESVTELESKLKKYDSKKWTDRAELVDVLDEGDNCIIGITNTKLDVNDSNSKKPVKAVFIFKAFKKGVSFHIDVYKYGFYKNPTGEGLYIKNTHVTDREVSFLARSKDMTLIHLTDSDQKYFNDFMTWYDENDKFGIVG